MDFRVNLFTRRIGGSFGSKIFRINVVAVAAAVAANKLSKPIRIYLPLEANMSLTSGREQYLFSYEVTVSTFIERSKTCFFFTADRR